MNDTKPNTMKSRTSGVALAALVLAAAVFLPAAAQAQSIKGRFHLPCTTYWANETLPAGDYTFQMSSSTNTGQLMIDGPKRLALIAISRPYLEVTKDAITVTRTSGAAVVKSMTFREGDLTFLFGSSRAARELLARNGKGGEVASLALEVNAGR